MDVLERNFWTGWWFASHRLVPLLIIIVCWLSSTCDAAAAWRPSMAERRFDIQLNLPLNLTRPTDILALDPFTTPPEKVAALRQRGVHTVCHVSVGHWQNWRPDAGTLPTAALGRSISGWPGERWVDIRNAAVRSYLERRLDFCRARGFDGVLLADLDGYQRSPGYPLEPEVQLAFNLWLASAAHQRGLAAGLFNDLGQASELAGAFDFLVGSDCSAVEACTAVQAFRQVGKPVYLIAFTNITRRMDLLCRNAMTLEAPLIFKTQTLNGKLHRRCP